MRLVAAGQRPLVHATSAAAATAAAASLLTAGRAVALALATSATTAMRLEQSCDVPRAQPALLVGSEEQTGGQVRSDTRDGQPKRKTLEAGGQARGGGGGGGGGGAQTTEPQRKRSFLITSSPRTRRALALSTTPVRTGAPQLQP